MIKRTDWKYILTLVVSIAGVAITYLVYRADLESRSLRFVVVSKTELQPSVGALVPDLKVTLDGAVISSPALTVVRLSNEGTRPIPAGDFEAPLRLSVAPPATLVRASVTDLNPTELSPTLTRESDSIAIAPMLLNPGDSITIALLTSGIPKSLVSKARISGVRTVPVEEPSNNAPRPIVPPVPI